MLNKDLIAINSGSQPLSKLQKQFNNYLRRIEKLKAEIEHTRTTNDYIHKKMTEVLLPVEVALLDTKTEWIKKMDWAYDSLKMRDKDKETLSEIIASQIFDLLNVREDDALAEIYQKHNDGTSFEEESKSQDELMGETMKGMFSSMYGLEFDEDVDVSDPAKFQEHLMEQIKKKEAEEEERQANRKKTKKQIEREEREQQEAQSISKSVRDIYTKLVKAFHPDSEQDEEERDRKTEIMKRITAAKDSNDLVGLLRLQLEYEQIDQTKINQLADNQLKNYNKVLKEQIDALDFELQELKGDFDYDNPYVKFHGDHTFIVDMKIDQAKKDNEKFIRQMKQEIEMFDHVDAIKNMVKDYRKEMKRREKYEGNLFDFF
jgi:hypothetical protein